MTKLTPQPRRKIEKALRKLGFIEAYGQGGHITWRRESDNTLVTILHHKDNEIGIEQQKEIMKIIGISRDEFYKLL